MNIFYRILINATLYMFFLASAVALSVHDIVSNGDLTFLPFAIIWSVVIYFGYKTIYYSEQLRKSF